MNRKKRGVSCIWTGLLLTAVLLAGLAAGGCAGGNISGNSGGEAGASGERTPGRVSGDTSGQVSGDTSGRVSGDTPGRDSGDTSGRVSGSTSGQTSGSKPGRSAGNREIGTEDGRIRVVTTIFPYYDFTRQIAGDSVKLKLIVPAGMDSHSFEPTPADMIAIEEADVLICNGGEMEQWVKNVLDSLDTSHMKIVTMMDYLDVVEEEHVEGMEDADTGHSHGNPLEEPEGHDAWDDGHQEEIEYDEHIWTSPVNAQAIVKIISQILAEADPGNRERFETNTMSYLNDLGELDREFRLVTEQARNPMIVVADKFPFRYFADEYGLSYRAAFSGCSTDTEPSARTIAYLIDRIKDQKIPAVYYLELSSHRTAEIISEETGAVPLLLHSCHNVTRRQFDEGVTYLQLMRQNVVNLEQGLQ